MLFIINKQQALPGVTDVAIESSSLPENCFMHISNHTSIFFDSRDREDLRPSINLLPME